MSRKSIHFDHPTTITPSELAVLKYLETTLGQEILWRDKLEWNDVGYTLNKENRNVTALNLFDTLISDLTPLAGLENLQSLRLSGTSVSNLSRLAWSKNLQSLDLYGTQISNLSPLAGLENLQSLRLDKTPISDLSPLAGLTSLTKLYLTETQVRDLTPLAGLKNLQSLDLSTTPVSNLMPLAGLENLQSLTLSSSPISDLTPLAGLKNLQSLILNSSPISDLTPLAGLKNLQSLILNSSPISDLTPLAGLTSLTKLYLWKTQVHDLTPLAGLTSLTELDLWKTQVHDLTPLTGLTELKTLELRETPIQTLPVKLIEQADTVLLKGDRAFEMFESVFSEFDFTGNKKPHKNKKPNTYTKPNADKNQFEIVLGDNPLVAPPLEVIKEGKKAILDYLRQQAEVGLDYIYEAKLLIVGEPGAGKTSLARKLQDEHTPLPKEDTSTKGIDVLTWNFPLYDAPVDRFQVNLWDFGGQEIYKATHQFFLTHRSMYVLVADNRKEDTDFNYWLEVLDKLSEGSPVIIVLNEKGDRAKQGISESTLRGRFTNLKEITYCNLATNRGLDEITQHLKHYLKHLPHVGQTLPATWVRVRQALETMDAPYITVQDYLQLCQQNDFERERDALQLSQYLHDLGVVLHFQDDPLLQRTVILEPEWGTEAVYKVLDDPQVIAQNGRFSQGDLDNIWQDSQYRWMHAELLKLMMRFQLCYEIPTQPGHYIAPQRLPADPPAYAYAWPEADNRQLRYRYSSFMPKGLLTRFIVLEHAHILHRNGQDIVWKSGVVLEKDATQAEVIEHYHRGKIHIRVQGQHKREMLTLLINSFKEIHRPFKKLEYETLIPCNCSKCQGVTGKDKPTFFPVDVLRQFTNDGQPIQCQKSYQMVQPRALLGDVLTEDSLSQFLARGGTYIDQRGQTVHGSQYNAGRNINQS